MAVASQASAMVLSRGFPKGLGASSCSFLFETEEEDLRFWMGQSWDPGWRVGVECLS